MFNSTLQAGIEGMAQLLEVIGVAVIGLAFLHALVRGGLHLTQRREDAYERLRTYIGKSLLLGLEFLVAADIIRTVTSASTRDGLLSLAMLILLRILLGWSISVEVNGCWPWRMRSGKPGAETSEER